MALIRLRINAGWSEPSLITQRWKSYFAAPFVIFMATLASYNFNSCKPYHMRLCAGVILRQVIKWTKTLVVNIFTVLSAKSNSDVMFV